MAPFTVKLQAATLEQFTALCELLVTTQPLPPWQPDDELAFNLLCLPMRDGV